MTTEVDKWAKRVTDAEDHAKRVYQDEVERLERQIKATDRREEREIKHVEHQVEIDAAFAVHHIDHLKAVIDHEAERVARAYNRLDKLADKGASEERLQRAAEHAARTDVAAAKHIEAVAESTWAGIERDAKAAAHHVVVGLDDLGLDEEHLGYDVEADAERVAAALENIVKKADES